MTLQHIAQLTLIEMLAAAIVFTQLYVMSLVLKAATKTELLLLLIAIQLTQFWLLSP